MSMESTYENFNLIKNAKVIYIFYYNRFLLLNLLRKKHRLTSTFHLIN